MVSLSETSWVCGLRLCAAREQDSLSFARLGHTKHQNCRAEGLRDELVEPLH